jgi:hypothetical protein
MVAYRRLATLALHPMTAGRVSVIGLLALTAALTGCGSGGGHPAPDASQLPLVAGAKIVAQDTQCDRGANAFCALELVVVNPRYKTSADFVDAEHDFVHSRGWDGVTADTGDERAAESPGHKLRVTYATALGDLQGIELGWIHRSHTISKALSRTLFDHASAMSVELDTGSS